MPLVEVTLTAGRTDEQVRALIHELHEAVLRTVGTRPEHIRVIVREVPRSHWATGDVTLSEMDAQQSRDRPDGPSGADRSGPQRSAPTPSTPTEDQEPS